MKQRLAIKEVARLHLRNRRVTPDGFSMQLSS